MCFLSKNANTRTKVFTKAKAHLDNMANRHTFDMEKVSKCAIYSTGTGRKRIPHLIIYASTKAAIHR